MDVAEIIKACGGDGAVAARVGTNPNTVTHWRRRGSIPPEHWAAIVDLGAEREARITLEHLASIRAGRRRARRAAAPHRATGIPLHELRPDEFAPSTQEGA